MSISSSFNSLKVPDFNGDGKSDAYWFNRATGQTEFWLMDGVNLRQSVSSLTIGGSEGWSNPMAADFDGDGKSDLFWRHSRSGDNVIWLLDGTSVKQITFIPALDHNWGVETGDFNGDRKADLYWHNSSTGENRIWLMDGIILKQEAMLPTVKDWEPSLADFNADGKSDLFFRQRTTGENAVWIMDGGSIVKSTYVRSQPPSWSYQLVDYNSDGRSDVIWHDSVSARVLIWEWSTDGVNPTNTDLEFPAQGRDVQYLFADFGGDSRADVLVRNPSTGTNQLLINEGALLRRYDLMGLPSDWQPSAIDFNGNGKGELVWQNVSDGTVLTWRLEDQRVVEMNILPNRSILDQWNPIW